MYTRIRSMCFQMFVSEHFYKYKHMNMSDISTVIDASLVVRYLKRGQDSNEQDLTACLNISLSFIINMSFSMLESL